MGSLKALVLLADGVSCTELIPFVDVFRRTNLTLILAGVEGRKPVRSDSNVCITPDVALTEAAKDGPYDVIVVPGGPKAAEIIANSKECGVLLTLQATERRAVAALGAGCVALMRHGVGRGKKMAASPFCVDQMRALNADKGWNLIETEPIVVDGWLATSQGALFAMDLSFDLLQKLMGKKPADEVADFILHKRHSRRRFSK